MRPRIIVLSRRAVQRNVVKDRVRAQGLQLGDHCGAHRQARQQQVLHVHLVLAVPGTMGLLTLPERSAPAHHR